MDLIFWRHAEAQDDAPQGEDLQRPLTPRGEKQAARVAAWLDRQLPEGARVICSPAVRCEQTALALGRKYKVRDELSPGAPADGVLAAAQWPTAKQPVVVVGHQPTIGEAIAQLLRMPPAAVSVRKGAVWWLRCREREGERQVVLVAVQSPDTL